MTPPTVTCPATLQLECTFSGPTDLSGNSASCSTVWTVVDTRPPNLYLEGPSHLTLSYGQPYVEQGVSGNDQCDGYYPAGPTWSRLTISGSVNSWVPGTYTLTYSIADNAGNVRTTTRTVTVLNG